MSDTETEQAELTAAERAAIALLAGALESVRAGLVACDAAGLEPVDSFAHVGIEVPAPLAPMLNIQLRQLLA